MLAPGDMNLQHALAVQTGHAADMAHVPEQQIFVARRAAEHARFCAIGQPNLCIEYMLLKFYLRLWVEGRKKQRKKEEEK